MMTDPLQDGISKVELIDHMGSDLTVVNAARVSMAKESDWEYICPDPEAYPDMYYREMSEKDTKLINYLATHGHWTPFSQPQIQLRIKMPIFIARQWYKHQVGFTRNEVSRRYVSDEPEFYFPKEFRSKADNVKQGSTEEAHEYSAHYIKEYTKAVSSILIDYNQFIKAGICPEQARMVLPQSMYTEFVETGSLAAYARLCKLRLDSHAQKEIQRYAQAVATLIEPLFPVSWDALSK